MSRTNSRGFTLIELLIVIAVIAILAALAIPNLIGARKAANETNAIAQLRAVITGEESYKSRNLGTGSKYATLAQLEGKSLVNWPVAATFKKNSFTFSDVGTPDATNYGVYAKADDTNSGDRDFVCTNDGFIRSQTSAGATLPTTVAAAQVPANFPVLQ